MRIFSKCTKDLVAGSLMTIVGALSIAEAMNYRLGTAAHMGPGYFPLGLGALLVALGLGIIVVDAMGAPAQTTSDEASAPQTASWRALISLPLSILLFATVVTRFGLGPAMFLAVFVSTFADRSLTLTKAVAIALTMTIVCILVFRVGLNIQTRAFIW